MIWRKEIMLWLCWQILPLIESQVRVIFAINFHWKNKKNDLLCWCLYQTSCIHASFMCLCCCWHILMHLNVFWLTVYPRFEGCNFGRYPNDLWVRDNVDEHPGGDTGQVEQFEQHLSIQQHQGVQRGPWQPCLPSKIGSFAEHICIRHDRSTCQKPVKRSRFVQQVLTFVNEIDDSEWVVV